MSQPIIDWNSPQINDLLVFLQEIIRDDRSREPAYKFVDAGFVDLLNSKRNHVIFGRRGSGKSVLLRELERQSATIGIFTILIDIEGIAQKSYPNLIVEILLEIFRSLLERTREGFLSGLRRRGLIKELESVIHELQLLRVKPDEMKQTVSKREEKEFGRAFEPELAAVQNVLSLAAKLSDKKVAEQTIETEETWQKIRVLFNSIRTYRELIRKWLDFMGGEILYLLIDDFYQIDLMLQTLVADYLKRLIRGIPCYLKIATVRNRSLLFVKDNLTEAGLQAEEDYTSLDLDYSLGDFQRAHDFLSAILYSICERKLGPLMPDALFEFSGTSGLYILTEASGGNPRDFINLLRTVITSKRLARAKNRIEYQDIRSAAISNHGQLKREAQASFLNFDLLSALLREIVDVCCQAGDIGFYVPRPDAREHPSLASLVGQLADCRFLHLLTRTYSPREENATASVYVLSMGIYSEYISDTSLVDRQLKQQSYPKLPLAKLSAKFPDLSPALELIGKSVN